MKKFNSKTWGEVHIQELKYANNNRLALQLATKGSVAPVGILTVNLPEEELSDGEFFVKTWGENEEISVEALASGFFIDTGRRVKTGHCEAQVWRFNRGLEIFPEEENNA